ncbi:MAG: hypothetical protein IPM29_21520 [Planctomycetes bacterium]|nr:hypothetical protein [Planctomycetota bacterium]
MASDDELAKHPVDTVHAFYRRLAAAAAERAKQDRLERSLAAELLSVWLDPKISPRDPYVFDAPEHLVGSGHVRAVLRYHRAVYLSERKARLGEKAKTEVWAGLGTRLADGRWDGRSPIAVHYTSLVEVPIDVQFRAYAGMADPADFDILTSLRGFQLRTDIRAKGQSAAAGGTVTAVFMTFTAQAEDTYDWDYSEYFTVPNPDYGKDGDGRIAPAKEKVRVYHSNARRLENAGLAKPYKLASRPWTVTYADVTAPGKVIERRG